MQTIPVAVPGIMGSSLTYGYLDHGRPLYLWDSDIYGNYERLIRAPGTLNWNGNRAVAELIPAFSISAPILLFGGHFSLKKAPVWEKTLRWIDGHPGFCPQSLIKFGYDWRAPLVETASELQKILSRTVEADLDSQRPPNQSKFSLIGHSMGGVILLLAVGAHRIDPSWIDRIVLIGTPIKGAQSAFSAAYDEVNLPFFNEIFGLVRRKRLSLFYTHLLECIRTFPSLYSLLPFEEIPYLYYSASARSNPLRENSMPEEYRDIALQSHTLVKNAFEIILRNKMEVHAIFTEVNSNRKTDLEYRVTPFAPGHGYSISERVARTMYGDGTVPSDSARGETFIKQQSVINVDHAFLCNDDRVVECLTTLMPQEHTYAS